MSVHALTPATRSPATAAVADVVPGPSRAVPAVLGPAEGGLSVVERALRSPAQTLEPASRAFMEGRFRHDFGNVRLHAGPASAAATQAIGARAFTVGPHIVFGPGQYDPRSFEGTRLLAHELAHVVQQSVARPTDVAAASLTHREDPTEAEADHASRQVFAGWTTGSGVAVGRRAPRQLARAEFTVGRVKVDIDYGNVVAVPVTDYASAIEARFAAWTGGPATLIHADVTALGTSQKAWVLFALDLLVDNPVGGLDKAEAVRRLIAHAPNAQFRPLAARAGSWFFENEVLMVSGWFEKALTSSLAAPTGPRLTHAQRLLNPGGAAATGSSDCPSPRPASRVLDEAKLRSDLPPQLEAHLGQVGIASGASTPIATLRPVAALIQTAANRFFAPYANRGRGRGNVFLERWTYAAKVVESTAPTAAPTLEKRLAYLDNRARLVGGNGLFDTVHFDPRCAGDETVLDDILTRMEARPAIAARVDRILEQLSYTEVSATPRRVVINTQFDPNRTDACAARWRVVNTMCHELVHVLAHDDFRAKAAGRQILLEGFTEGLGDQLYGDVVRQALADRSYRRQVEAGITGAPCDDIPAATTGYGAAGQNAAALRVVVGDDRFRAAYFLGQVDLVGLAPKRAGMAPPDALERQALMAEDAMAARLSHSATTPVVRAAPAGRPTPEVWVHGLTPGAADGGRPLETATRRLMEAHLGHDFSRVRVHTDDRAADSARSVNALAFTVGRHVVFGAGQYGPATRAGQRLLAHELTHVIQQDGLTSPVLQRAPAPPASGTGDLQLPWTGRGVSLFDVRNSGIRFLVGVLDAEGKTIRSRLGAIGKRIAADNRLIKDAAFQVKTCIIARTTTRFSLYEGAPVLALDPAEATEDTVAHEMGHALFHYFSARGASSAPDAAKARNLRQRVGDIHARLGNTKLLLAKGTLDQDEEHPIGHWMVDPSQWQPGRKPEHPWDDPDEFFASAKEAYQLDRKALVRSIDRAVKLDGAVHAPAHELLDLLANLFGAGRLPDKAIPAGREPAAEAALQRAPRVTSVEDTLAARADEPLGWLLDPGNRPAPAEAEPGDVRPSAPPRRPEHPNLVTGPGGVQERMQKRFKERLREKVLESVDELP